MNGPSPEVIAAVIFTVLVVGMGATILLLIQLMTRFVLKTYSSNPRKDAPYECGVPLLGSARERFDIRFYLIAILFVLFDIETVFLLPYAVCFRALGMQGLFEVLMFVAILGLGLIYLIKRGALDWERANG
jgi:NADH-quinone oxidoreductase subunit A